MTPRPQSMPQSMHIHMHMHMHMHIHMRPQSMPQSCCIMYAPCASCAPCAAWCCMYAPCASCMLHVHHVCSMCCMVLHVLHVLHRPSTVQTAAPDGSARRQGQTAGPGPGPGAGLVLDGCIAIETACRRRCARPVHLAPPTPSVGSPPVGAAGGARGIAGADAGAAVG